MKASSIIGAVSAVVSLWSASALAAINNGATGADAFADWIVAQVGRWGNHRVTLEKTDTGLWIVVKPTCR